jgi:chemotaxis methyl-accepting protein methylase
LQLAGISGEGYRTAVLQRRLPACLRALRAVSTTDALQQARLRPDGRRSVANSFLLGVTGFFRDPGVFAFLRHTVLPGLLSSRPNLRVLSLGCSTGEELYSLAFLLHELGALAGSELVGLDARLDAVEDASAGLYPVAELEAVPAQFHNLFRPSGRKLEIVPEVRRPVSFLVRDILLEPIPPGSWDLVMFRNVAIYLSPAASERLWEGLAGGVAAGGILVTGKAERPPAEQPFRRLFPCVYSRK